MKDKREFALKIADIRMLLKFSSTNSDLSWGGDFDPFLIKSPSFKSFDITISNHHTRPPKDFFSSGRLILDAEKIMIFYLSQKFYFIISSFGRSENITEILLKRDFVHKNFSFYIEQPLILKIKRRDLPLPKRTAVFNEKFNKGDIFMGTASSESVFQNPLAPPLLKIIITNFLSSFKGGSGLIVHGSAVRDADKVYLFLGRSGCGKSTMLKIWKRENKNTIIQDENVIIRGVNNSFLVFSLPGYTINANPLFDGAKLKKIFFLHHANKNTVKELNPLSATHLLLRNSNFQLSVKSLDTLLSFSERLTSGGACYSL